MSYVIATPAMLTTAAADVAGIGSAITEATATAAGPTAGLAAAAADEVSAAAAGLFRTYAQEYQAVLTQAVTFHDEFAQALAAAGAAYAEAEAVNAAVASSALNVLNAPAQALLGRPLIGNGAPGGVGAPTAAPTLTGPVTALIMGGVGNPGPIPLYLTLIQNQYIHPLYPTASPLGLYTPEQFWPDAGATALKFGQSLAQGVPLLDAGIKAQLTAGHSAVVLGYSESATIATDEMNAIMALPAGQRPDASQLAFILIGDPNNPNGGILERFTGLYVPVLDVPFNGATPSNTPYATTIYTVEYDGIADAPRYPLNVLADINAYMGFGWGLHASYPQLTPTQIANFQPLPTSPGYTGNTQYSMLLTQNLPLLDPMRNGYPHGVAIADLIQPDLRVLVDLGYGNTGVEYANIPTPASLIELINPVTVGIDLAKGAVQGPIAALIDLGVLPSSDLPTTYPYVPSLDPGLSFNLPQSSVTGVSLLTGAIGTVESDLRLIPTWDDVA